MCEELLMSFLSRMSLANRSLVALATIAILIFGALVIPALKQELYPSLEFPAVTVITSYPGTKRHRSPGAEHPGAAEYSTDNLLLQSKLLGYRS
jgi:hypothetical protein